MPRYKNKTASRLSFSIPGQKGVKFVDAFGQIYLSKQELIDLIAAKYVLDSCLELVQNQPTVSAPQAEEPKADKAVQQSPKPKRKRK